MCSSRPPRMALIWESTSTKGHLWQSLDRSKAGVSEGCTISPAGVPVGCSHLLRYQAVSSSLTGRNLVLSFFFWPCFVAYELLVPQPGTEPRPPALGARSLNHWTTREVPKLCLKHLYTPNASRSVWCLRQLSKYLQSWTQGHAGLWDGASVGRVRGHRWFLCNLGWACAVGLCIVRSSKILTLKS